MTRFIRSAFLVGSSMLCACSESADTQTSQTSEDPGTTGTTGGPSATADPDPSSSSGSLDPTSDTSAEGSSGSSGSSSEESSTGDGACVPYAPWLYADFEQTPVGGSLGGDAPFNTAGRTVSTDAQAYAGSRAAQMEIRSMDGGGFGQWGGIITLPDVPEGETVWVRLWAYWPSDFEFSATPWMKFIRLHDRRPDGSNGGYNDLYIDDADGPESVLRIIKETHDVWEVYDGDPIPRDQWERYEIQLVVDDTPVDDGGEARFRVWRDDTLIFDRTDVPTVSEPGGVLDGLYLFTYWNNEMPPDNVMYIDELAVTFGDAPPPRVDDNGLPYFGDWLPCR